MPEIKYAEIDQTKDFKDLFELVCSEVLARTTIEVKRDVLKWKGTDKELSNKAINAGDLFLLFDKIDMPFKLKIRYTVPAVKEVSIPAPVEPVAIVNAMKEQENDMVKTPAPTGGTLKEVVSDKTLTQKDDDDPFAGL